MKLRWMQIRVCAVVLTLSLSAAPQAAKVTVDPNDYPRMTDKEVGHVRHMARLAHNPYGDWTGFGTAYGPLQREQVFVVSFMALALELAQHELTPAYHEIYQSPAEQLLKKLQHPDIWERWLFESRNGSIEARPGESLDWMTNPGWIDPIVKDNIQLKAYILQIAANYQMLYGDDRYEKPGAFTFKWTGGMSNGQMNFRYTLTDIARNIYEEVVDSGYVGSACEPGRVFWICNGPSNAGFVVYDHLYGTHYADAGPKMRAKWIQEGYRDPKSYTTVMFVTTSLRDPSKDVEPRTPLMGIGDAEEGGWGAVYNVAWDYDYTRAQYQAHRDEELDQVLSGKKFQAPQVKAARSAADSSQALASSFDMTSPEEVAARMGLRSFQEGFFMAYAAEMGDQDAKQKMLDYAERNFGPKWENGEYYYPRNDDYAVDERGNVHGVDVWAGSVLIPMARFNRGHGLQKLYTDIKGRAQYQEPFISNIDTLTAGVTQASFDPRKNALIVSLIPGPIAAQEVTFVVRQLDPEQTYEVIKDGRLVGELNPKHQPASTAWREDGTVLVATSIAESHTFVFVAQ